MFKASLPKGKGPAFRPQLRVCYLCGQQFGSASIGIHIPQCYQKKLSQWEVGNPATRGKKPKHPDSVNWNGPSDNVQKFNDDQFKEFTSNLVPCPNCGRTFLPDRLAVHSRSCRGGGGGGGGGGGTNRGSNLMASTTREKPTTPESTRDGSTKRQKGFRPILPMCYLCGQQFGTASFAIHIPQCYAKKLGQWEASDPMTRGAPPKHPDTVNWKGNGGTSQENTDAQFAEFVSNLEPCPNCGRKFFADRLVVHLRSCKPGNTAKPVTQSPKPPSEAKSPVPNPHLTQKSTRLSSDDKNAAETPEKNTDISSSKINPMKNRLPKEVKVSNDGHIICPQCKAVEKEGNAKFCRECGTNLFSKSLPDPCSKCGEGIPEGSRFCATCGFPVDGAAADERTAGAENVNVPTVRMVTCPACRAYCDADGNFCDNCGAALGEAEPAVPTLPASKSSKKPVMYCKACNASVEDLSSKFCEDCGGTLEQIEVGDRPSSRLGTLPPGGVTVKNRQPDGADPADKSGRKQGNFATKETNSTANTGNSMSRPQTMENNPGKGSRGSIEATPNRRGTSNAAPDSRTGREGEQGNPTTATKPRVSFSSDIPDEKPRSSMPPKMENAAEIPEYPESTEDAEPRMECPKCSRKFAEPAFSRHVNHCTSQKKRKTFDVAACRTAGTGCEELPKKRAPTPEAPKKDWKSESEAFRRALREARQVDKILKSGGTAKDLPPPTYSENSHYKPCPHCGRKFAPDVAERHIPRCATTVNRPKPPPKRR